MPMGSFGLLLLLLLGTFLYSYQPNEAPPPALAAASNPTGLAIEYEVTASDIEVDWPGGGVSAAERGGDFDPRDKCPPDFFKNGFVLVCKKLNNGAYIKFLYHKGRKLLYRVDKDVVNGKARAGLHWVASTKSTARYRIADPAYKGGKAVKVPNAKGGMDTEVFRYGQAVSKRKAQHHRELFRETHISPEQCPEWWDIFNFMP